MEPSDPDAEAAGLDDSAALDIESEQDGSASSGGEASEQHATATAGGAEPLLEVDPSFGWQWRP